jgi:hypothetical protein
LERGRASAEAVAVRLPGSGLAFGVNNLRSLLNFTREFRLSYEGRAYVVDQIGRLISAADVSLVLQQISFANRPLIRQLIDPKNPDFSLEMMGDGLLGDLNDARHDQRNGITVRVQDTGVGISPDEIANLFQKYQQSISGKTSERHDVYLYFASGCRFPSVRQ